jgi:hypothetical protein
LTRLFFVTRRFFVCHSRRESAFAFAVASAFLVVILSEAKNLLSFNGVPQ